MMRFWILKFFSPAFCFLLINCVGESQDLAISLLTSEDLCQVDTLHHEHEFADDLALRARFDELVVAHLESSTETSVHENDSGTPGQDVIPYYVEEDQNYDFELSATGPALRATLTDSHDNVVATINRGDPVQRVALSAGEHTLALDGDTDGGLVFVTPSQCNNSAQLNLGDSMERSLLKQATFSAPGVYIAETSASQTIVGASTAVTAFVGYAAEGPQLSPIQVTRYSDFTSQFGALSADSLLSQSVYGYFENGGVTAHVVSVPARADGSLPTAEDIAESGLQALATVLDFDLLVIPDLSRMTAADGLFLTQSAMNFASDNQVFFIADFPQSLDTVSLITSWAEQIQNPLSGSYTALYYPQIIFRNPFSPAQRFTLGAGGVMAGLFSTVDLDAGVWQSPSGFAYPLTLVSGLSSTILASALDSITSQGVNPLRLFYNYEFASGGAITLSSSQTYLNIATRRLVTYVEKSLKQGLAWTAFESNNADLRNRVAVEASGFLTSLWQQGALYGANSEQAFSVICDSSNNTPATIATGVLYLDVSIAPDHPSEFVVISVELSVSQDS